MLERVDLEKTYREGFEKRQKAFDDILTRASERNYQSGQINGYSVWEAQLLPVAIAIAASPELLDLSHCTHRAVSASLLMTLSNKVSKQTEKNVIDYAKEKFHLGTMYSSFEQSFLLLQGTNNWFDAVGQMPDSDLYFCKTEVGSPTEVKRENLRHLPEELAIDDISQTDNACIKRLKGVGCKIAHAERSVINIASELINRYRLGAPQKSVLVCTWVPCPDCLHLITDLQRPSNLEVLSLYTAVGDQEDSQMARKIQEELQKEHLGIFSGPYISIPKIPGYGWMPRNREFIADITGKLHTVRDKRARLLAEALSLI